MKWFPADNRPRPGDKRVKTRFLLFPKTINGERRWLETATWTEYLWAHWDGSVWEDLCWGEYESPEEAT